MIMMLTSPKALMGLSLSLSFIYFQSTHDSLSMRHFRIVLLSKQKSFLVGLPLLPIRLQLSEVVAYPASFMVNRDASIVTTSKPVSCHVLVVE